MTIKTKSKASSKATSKVSSKVSSKASPTGAAQRSTDAGAGGAAAAPSGGGGGSAPAAPAAPTGPTAAASPTWTLGELSEKYETGGRGPGTVSSGVGDPGGVSYGLYQMTSRNGGTVAAFVGQSGFPWREEFRRLTPGSAGFSARWREIAAREPERFRAAQHDFVRRTHFEPLAARLRRDFGLDVATRSPALQDVVWSTAVQHGPRTQVMHKALETLKARAGALDFAAADFDVRDFDARLIRAVYAERGARNDAGQLKYFRRASKAVQEGVARRFAAEERDALARLGAALKAVPDPAT